MARGRANRERSIVGRTKVKTGCATCKVRKVKCDERKPSCQKCVSTGRKCDGYDSPFRICINPTVFSPRTGSIVSQPETALQPPRPTSTEINSQDIDLLNRYFHTKTMFDVKLGCEDEARQLLQASLTDLPVRHAVRSLRALRKGLESTGYGPASVMKRIPTSTYGLQQYNMALGGLASSLSSPSTDRLRSALLCCQIFISIEQVRGNYAAMGQHITRGLRILQESHARPSLDDIDRLVPAHHDSLPFLDMFIIKLFAAPCRFSENPVNLGGEVSTCLLSDIQRADCRPPRTIVPDMRAELTKIAKSTVDFLGRVSHADSAASALQLRSSKTELLESLETWFKRLNRARAEIKLPGPEPLAISFLRYFHAILRIIILGALEATPHIYNELGAEGERLHGIASSIGERVRAAKSVEGAIMLERQMHRVSPEPELQ